MRVSLGGYANVLLLFPCASYFTLQPDLLLFAHSIVPLDASMISSGLRHGIRVIPGTLRLLHVRGFGSARSATRAGPA